MVRLYKAVMISPIFKQQKYENKKRVSKEDG